MHPRNTQPAAYWNKFISRFCDKCTQIYILAVCTSKIVLGNVQQYWDRVSKTLAQSLSCGCLSKLFGQEIADPRRIALVSLNVVTTFCVVLDFGKLCVPT